MATRKRKSQSAEVRRYDVAEHLHDDEEMALYLQAIVEEYADDPQAPTAIARALGDIARARGMAAIAREAGLSRESLYKALSGERSPELATSLKVSRALGLKWSVQPA
jgi:probable addiction module antidote protein